MHIHIQLKEFWISEKNNLNTTAVTAGGAAGNSVRPVIAPVSSLHQGFSLTNLVQGQSNSEILKRHVNELDVLLLGRLSLHLILLPIR